VPLLIVTVLFRLEVQHDFWMLSAWLPLWLVGALGMSMAGKLREAAVGLALVGVTWAVIANRSDLDQRNYTLAETYGSICLDTVGPRGILWVHSDDGQSTTVYLQSIRKVRPDVSLLGEAVRWGTFDKADQEKVDFLMENR
jgi:hypothetical protein